MIAKKIDLLSLISKYGDDVTLKELKEIMFPDEIHPFLKCKGIGQEKYNAYPSGLPDSGYVYKEGFQDCSLCKGHGFTKDKYSLKPVKFDYIKE